VVTAALLAIIVSPGVTWLEKRRVPKVAAVVVMVVAMVLAFTAMGALVAGSLAGFRESAAAYEKRLVEMLASVAGWLRTKEIQIDLDKALQTIEPGAAVQKGADVVLDSVQSVLAAISNILFIAITMILILMEGATVPDKLRALSDDPDADISYFRHIASQVQSYLAIKTVLSLATGLAVGLWAFFLDVDFAILWGLLAFLLNYIPNIGSIIAAVPAMLLALIQHGVGTSLGLGAGYVVVNMVIGNVVEPMWMGRKMGLSTTVVFISLAVWYEIWGPIGMLLSVPLTMIIKIMLEHSRDYAFVAALLDSGESPDDGPAVGDIEPGASESLE
jgi:predicted PurR-regulated permease PerM